MYPRFSPKFFGWFSVLISLTTTAMAVRFQVTVSHQSAEARPAETIVLPFAEVRARLPEVRFDHVQVRRADTGAVVAAQVTNFNPDDRQALYDDLVWQHDFAAGETSATFLVETTDAVVPPFQTKVFARHVPERLDDFAWENDRMAHRAYGPGLDTPAAGKSQMISSGIDYWSKRVRYPIVDRWYLKGHDAYHIDTGEGVDDYSVGTNRGVGGLGVWRDGGLKPSHNWAAARVLANGPIRAVFELDYAPWDAGAGVTVSETKRFTVDAGLNFDRIESTFHIVGADEVDIAVGLSFNAALQPITTQRAEQDWISDWSTYAKGGGQLGTTVILSPGAGRGFAEDSGNRYILTRVRNGETLTYFAGGGWTRSGDFSSQQDWENYVRNFAQRLRQPLNLTLDPLL